MSKQGATDGSGATALAAVKRYVEEHSAIEFTATGSAIPRSEREGFFAQLNEARLALAREALGEASFARACSDHLAAVRERLKREYGLSAGIPSELKAFCANVEAASSDLAVDTMLSWLQGRLDDAACAEKVRATAAAECDRLAKAAYELWQYLTVVDLLAPTEAYLASTPDQESVVLTPTTSFSVGAQAYSPVLRLPELVLVCEKGVFGLRFELATEVDFYGTKPLRRRDYSTGGDSRDMVGRRYGLIYRFAGLDAVPIVVNRDKTLVVPPRALVGAMFPDDVEQTLYCRGTIQRVLTLDCPNGAFFADPLGCAAGVRDVCEPYGFEPAMGAEGFDEAGLAAYVASL